MLTVIVAAEKDKDAQNEDAKLDLRREQIQEDVHL